MSPAASDAMYDKVLRLLDCTECSGCEKRPELLWAWDGVNKLAITEDAAVAARTFTQSAVAHLKAAGWRMIGDAIYCPACAAKNALDGESREVEP